jgi:hypothetical protein
MAVARQHAEHPVHVAVCARVVRAAFPEIGA